MEASAFAIASFPCSVGYRLFSILIQKQPLQSWNVIKWKFWQYIFINEKIETPRITVNVCWLVCCQSVTHLIEDPSSAHTGFAWHCFLRHEFASLLLKNLFCLSVCWSLTQGRKTSCREDFFFCTWEIHLLQNDILHVSSLHHSCSASGFRVVQSANSASLSIYSSRWCTALCLCVPLMRWISSHFLIFLSVFPRLGLLFVAHLWRRFFHFGRLNSDLIRWELRKEIL